MVQLNEQMGRGRERCCSSSADQSRSTWTGQLAVAMPARSSNNKLVLFLSEQLVNMLVPLSFLYWRRRRVRHGWPETAAAAHPDDGQAQC